MTLGKHTSANGRKTYTANGIRCSNHDYSVFWLKAHHASRLSCFVTKIRKSGAVSHYVCAPQN